MKVYLLEVFDEDYFGVFTSFEKCVEAIKFLNEKVLPKVEKELVQIWFEFFRSKLIMLMDIVNG